MKTWAQDTQKVLSPFQLASVVCLGPSLMLTTTHTGLISSQSLPKGAPKATLLVTLCPFLPAPSPGSYTKLTHSNWRYPRLCN